MKEELSYSIWTLYSQYNILRNADNSSTAINGYTKKVSL